jgi:hypothetical protein
VRSSRFCFRHVNYLPAECRRESCVDSSFFSQDGSPGCDSEINFNQNIEESLAYVISIMTSPIGRIVLIHNTSRLHHLPTSITERCKLCLSSRLLWGWRKLLNSMKNHLLCRIEVGSDIHGAREDDGLQHQKNVIHGYRICITEPSSFREFKF